MVEIKAKIIVIFLFLLLLTQTLEAQRDISNKEILEYLHKIEIEMVKLREKQEALNKRLDNIQGLMWVILAGMFALVGFVIWVRRTALSPAIKKNKELENQSDAILNALKEYARKEPKLAAILKSFNLL